MRCATWAALSRRAAAARGAIGFAGGRVVGSGRLAGGGGRADLASQVHQWRQDRAARVGGQAQAEGVGRLSRGWRQAGARRATGGGWTLDRRADRPEQGRCGRSMAVTWVGGGASTGRRMFHDFLSALAPPYPSGEAEVGGEGEILVVDDAGSRDDPRTPKNHDARTHAGTGYFCLEDDSRPRGHGHGHGHGHAHRQAGTPAGPRAGHQPGHHRGVTIGHKQGRQPGHGRDTAGASPAGSLAHSFAPHVTRATQAQHTTCSLSGSTACSNVSYERRASGTSTARDRHGSDA